jgi:hypothetical protein
MAASSHFIPVRLNGLAVWFAYAPNHIAKPLMMTPAGGGRFFFATE